MSRPARVPASSAGPPDKDHEKSRNLSERKPVSWRPIGTAATSIGAPTGVGLFHPMLGIAVFLSELAVMLVILGTALFGTKEYSERAFRLLRWIAGRPEPEAPLTGSVAQIIGNSASSGAGKDERHRPAGAEFIPPDRAEEDADP